MNFKIEGFYSPLKGSSNLLKGVSFKAVARILGRFHARRLRDGVNLIVFYVLYFKKQAFYVKV